MIKLEETFISGVGGFGADVLTYTQLMRTDTIAMYQRSRNGRVKDIEVFVIKIIPKGFQVFNGKAAEDDTEMYCSTGNFSKTGWSFHGLMALQAATKKFNELNNKSVKVEDESIVESDTVEKIESDHAPRRGRQPKVRTALLIPVGEFSIKEMNELNKSEYQDSLFFINEQIAAGTIKFLREERRNAKGKPSRIFSKV